MTRDEFAEQTIREQREHIKKMTREAIQMRGALLIVAEWKVPHPGMGSNDERDHFKSIAQGAINATST